MVNFMLHIIFYHIKEQPKHIKNKTKIPSLANSLAKIRNCNTLLVNSKKTDTLLHHREESKLEFSFMRNFYQHLIRCKRVYLWAQQSHFKECTPPHNISIIRQIHTSTRLFIVALFKMKTL